MGIETGFKVTATIVDNSLDSPMFTRKPTFSVDEEGISISLEHQDITDFV